MHILGVYRQKHGIRLENFPDAYLGDQLTIALPLYTQMTDAEQDYVISQLHESKW